MRIPPLRWIDPPDGPAIELLDQTRLPATETVLTCRDVDSLVAAISRLAVRGAPLLGVAGGFGVALAAHRRDDVAAAAAAIAAARPTAVNLGWGVRRALDAYRSTLACADPDSERLAAGAALAEAKAIAAEDAAASAAIAEYGLALVPAGARILTHCNTGALVSAGAGTAFAVILAAHRAGRLARLWVDETRPLLQGARLTSYEARQAGLPYAVLPDAAAASLMAAGEVDMVLLGADRVAADGTVANKVGTYSLAVLARHHAGAVRGGSPGIHDRFRRIRRRGDRHRAPGGRGSDQFCRGARRGGREPGLQPGLRHHAAGPGLCPGHRAGGCAARQCRYPP